MSVRQASSAQPSMSQRPSLVARLRSWMTGMTLAGALFVWGLPSVSNTFNDKTWWVLRWIVQQGRIIGEQFRPLVIALIVCTAIAWMVAWWANRQRRRITDQVSRLLRMYPNQLRTRIVVGKDAPRMARISIAPGYSFKDELVTEATQAISRAWNYVYTLRHEEYHDRIILVRARRPGLQTVSSSQDSTEVYESDAHERLETVKDKFPIKVTSVSPTDYDTHLEQPTTYDIRYETVANAALENWRNKVSGAIVELVGRAPDGYQWNTEWFPHEDRVRLHLEESPPEPQPLSGYLAHPPIEDYVEALGTNRIVLPYATGSVSPYLWWDIDHRSNVPHGLIAGPTGGGKTTAIGTLISEGTRRDIPWILFDPKRFELTQFAYHPGVVGVATDIHACIQGIAMLWEENEQRSLYREKRPWVENKDMPLFGIVIDEFLLLSFMLQQEMKRDDEIKQLDPKGKLNTLITIIRAVGGRFCFGVQRPDASIWGGGNPRSSLGMRLAMSRNDPDGDEMMFDRKGVTAHLDRAVPGRAMGTDVQGDPEECQVWYTPNLNPHPLVHEKLSTDEQNIVRRLKPSREVSSQLWTPASSWNFMRPKYRLDDRPDQAEPSTSTEVERPDAPRGEVIVQDLDTAIEARKLEPEARIAADVDGTMVPGTIVDIEPDGDRLSLDVTLDGERGSETLIVDRDEMIGVVPTGAE